MKKTTSGFTLVELIVVITIVGILSTVGFVSYSGYLTGARDSNRISQMIKLSDSLQVYGATKSLPLPDNRVDITASGVIVAYQGYAGTDVLESIEYTNGGKDPKDDTYFTYSVNPARTKMQLLAFMEDGQSSSASISQGYAVDYEDRFPKVHGNKIGVLTDTRNIPIQELSLTGSVLDIVNTTDWYTAIFSDKSSITGTGDVLNMLETVLAEGGYRENVVLWYNMETDEFGGLKDISGNRNNAVRIGSGLVDIGGVSGVYGRATSFEGVTGGFQMNNASALLSQKFTLLLWQKSNTFTQEYAPMVTQWYCTTASGCDFHGGGEWWLGNVSRPYLNYNDSVRLTFGSGATRSLSSQDGLYMDGKWHHIGVTKTANELRMYIDGKLVDEVFFAEGNEIGNSSLPLYIGTSGHTTDLLDSASIIDEIRILNSALDEDDIAEIYGSGKRKLE